MAQYNGYVAVPHQSYDQWRAATIDNGYNVDFMYGNQCWDFCALLYWQYNLTLITKAGGGSAYECWTVSREANSKTPFISVEGVNNIKRGDIVVFNRSNISRNGHIAFADEDYNGSGNIKLLGQNQGGENGNVNVTTMSTSRFLGIFRNTLWTSSPEPPEPAETKKKKDFVWPVAWAHWDNFEK